MLPGSAFPGLCGWGTLASGILRLRVDAILDAPPCQSYQTLQVILTTPSLHRNGSRRTLSHLAQVVSYQKGASRSICRCGTDAEWLEAARPYHRMTSQTCFPARRCTRCADVCGSQLWVRSHRAYDIVEALEVRRMSWAQRVGGEDGIPYYRRRRARGGFACQDWIAAPALERACRHCHGWWAATTSPPPEHPHICEGLRGGAHCKPSMQLLRPTSRTPAEIGHMPKALRLRHGRATRRFSIVPSVAQGGAGVGRSASLGAHTLLPALRGGGDKNEGVARAGTRPGARHGMPAKNSLSLNVFVGCVVTPR